MGKKIFLLLSLCLLLSFPSFADEKETESVSSAGSIAMSLANDDAMIFFSNGEIVVLNNDTVATDNIVKNSNPDDESGGPISYDIYSEGEFLLQNGNEKNTITLVNTNSWSWVNAELPEKAQLTSFMSSDDAANYAILSNMPDDDTYMISFYGGTKASSRLSGGGIDTDAETMMSIELCGLTDGSIGIIGNTQGFTVMGSNEFIAIVSTKNGEWAIQYDPEGDSVLILDEGENGIMILQDTTGDGIYDTQADAEIERTDDEESETETE